MLVARTIMVARACYRVLYGVFLGHVIQKKKYLAIIYLLLSTVKYYRRFKTILYWFPSLVS